MQETTKTPRKLKKPRRKKSKMYFGSPAQDAIVKYNNSNNADERSKLYNEGIRQPFEK